MATVETIYRLLSDLEYVEIINSNNRNIEYYGIAKNIPLELLNCEAQQLIGGVHQHSKYKTIMSAHIIIIIVKE